MIAHRTPSGGREKCPSVKQLVHYVLGNLDDTVNHTLAEHTVHCQRCQQTLESLDANSDTLILRLRKSSRAAVAGAVPSRVIKAPRDFFPGRSQRAPEHESKSLDAQYTRDEKSPGLRNRAGPNPVSNEVDAVCDAFERAWSDTPRPRIEDYLKRVPADSRGSLVYELVALELDFRRREGDVPLRAEFVARFPRHAALLVDLDFGGSENSRDADFQVQEAEGDPEEEERGLKRAFDRTVRTPPQTRESIAHFVLLEEVGVGSFGAVWRAEDTQLHRIVALKLPRKGDLNPAEVEKFVREARSAAQLKHPHIVTVYEVSRDPLNPYIASEFIDGVCLKDWLTGKQMNPREAAVFCAKLARSLEHAHSLGVIHRDVKPGNVMVDDAGEPHLTDFGLAKRDNAEASVSADGTIMGTPAYMSPEQARGEGNRVTRATDIYSVGVMLYELLTGEPPFRGKVPIVLKQVLHDEPRLLSKVKRGLPRDLETICLKAMSKEAGKRYAYAADFAADLERFLRNEPIVARRTSLAGRAARWVRRNPHLAGVSALSCCLAAGLILFAFAKPHPPPGTQRVLLTTEPAGATVAIIPLNAAHGEPEPDKMIRPEQKSNLEVDLEPGRYLVVAKLDDVNFHEVYRYVPGKDQFVADAYGDYAKRLADGRIQWPKIKIPDGKRLTEEMARFEGTADFVMGAGPTLHHRAIPSFDLDSTEFTAGDYRKLRGDPPPHLVGGHPISDDDLAPLTHVGYDQAMALAELVGKRLPEHAEFVYAATDGGRRRFPWGNQINPDWPEQQEFGRVGHPAFDQLNKNRPVYGLCSNVAEWARTWTSAFSPPGRTNDGKPKIEAVKVGQAGDIALSRVVVGGRSAVWDGDPRVSETLRNPRTYHNTKKQTWKPGLGFRCARSAKPRMRPEDFIRILPAQEASPLEKQKPRGPDRADLGPVKAAGSPAN